MATQMQWGKITLLLENERFRHGFECGRAYYFETSTDEPEYVVDLTTQRLLQLIVTADKETGRYHFDEVGLNNLEEYLGVLLGFMSGPLIPPSPDEREAYFSVELGKGYTPHIGDTVWMVILPDPTNPALRFRLPATLHNFTQNNLHIELWDGSILIVPRHERTEYQELREVPARHHVVA